MMEVSIQESIEMTSKTTRITPIIPASSPIQNQTFHSPISKSDRFIPNRSEMDWEKSSHSVLLSQNWSFEGDRTDRELSDNEFFGGDVVASNMAEYESVILRRMGGSCSKKRNRILSFADGVQAPKGNTIHDIDILHSSSLFDSTFYRDDDRSTKLVNRHIPSSPSRVLDAPDMMDDYYLNLLSWSSTNVLAVALSQRVYLWNAETGRIEELCNFEDRGTDANVSSVSWVQEGGGYLAVGTSWGKTLIWDVQSQKQVRNMNGHSGRISSMSWNRHILSSGGGDNLIVNHDVRIAEHKVATLSNHTQEVCGLSWSPDGTTLASGANDNMVSLWDATASSSSRPRFEFTDHQAAVKALAWSPHERNLLATGGGTGCKCIKFWNTRTGSLLNSIDTGSQVSGLQWNPKEKEILSSHGYTENHLSLWKYPTMVKVKDLKGHTDRVLHMAVSPDGGSVVSAAADETLRFWNVFAPPSMSLTGKRGRSSGSSGRVMSNKLSRTMQIR